MRLIPMPSWEAIVPVQPGLCAICLETAPCAVADLEFGRPICVNCVWAVGEADIALRQVPGLCRPSERRLWN